MRVAVTSGAGSVTVADRPAPTPGREEVLVRFEAGTVNPVDAMAAAGTLHELVPMTRRELGLGWDLVGTVVDLGDDVPPGSPDVGRAVAGVKLGFDVAIGTLAEYVVFPVSDVAPVPDGLDVVAAAAVGMNALTAAQALDLLGTPAGRSLLVTGAAGSVGGYAVELAMRAGWKVSGLARDRDEEFVRGSGAELVTDPGSTGRTWDAVLDAAPLQLDPAAFAGHVVEALADGGSFVGVLGVVSLPVIPGASVTAVSVRPDGARLASLLRLAADGTITPRVAGTFPFSDVARAVDAVGTPGRRGRWVVVAD